MFDFRRLAVVALILVSACAGSNSADTPDQPPATESDDSTQSSSPDDETTEPSTTDAAFASYSDLVERAADGDPESVVQLALAETAVILGPLPGVPDVDPADVDIEVAAGALQVLIGSPDLVTGEQQAAIEGRLAEIDAASTVVYRTLDDPDYLAALEGGPGVDQEALADAADSEAGDDGGGGDTGEAEGLRSATTSQGPVGFGSIRPTIRINERAVETQARAAATAYARMAGGVPIDMEVLVVPAGELPDEYGRATGTHGIGLFNPVPNTLDDRDTSQRTCTVRIGDSPSVEAETAAFASIIAHEVFHCWQFGNIRGFSEIGMVPQSYKEGTATWAGDQRAGGSLYGREHMDTFFAADRFSLKTSSYDAVGFWAQIAELRGGPAGLWSQLYRINYLSGTGPVPVFELATSGISREAIAGLASMPLRESSWGSDWDLEGVTVTDGAWAAEPVGLGAIASTGPTTQKIVRFDLAGTLAADGWEIIEYEADGLTNAYWDIDGPLTTTSATTMRFCTQDPCECPDSSQPVFFDEQVLSDLNTELHVALTGAATRDSSVKLSVQTEDDLCEEVEVTLPPSDDPGALVGTWRADPASIDVMFEQASRLGDPEDGGVDVVGVAGDLIMEIFADGSGTLTYNDVSAVFAAGGALPDLTIQGSADFSYSVSVNKMILSNTEFELSATSTLLGDEPLTLTQDDVGGGNDGTTSFIIRSTDPVLVLENPSGSKGPVYFPAVWFRQ